MSIKSENLQYIVAAKGEWNKDLFESNSKLFSGDWFYCNSIRELDALLNRTAPKYIFFIHWSWIVSSDILEKFECVCFHMTDLPFGRGGSPLQNLIAKGHKDTVLTALKMESGIDTGPVYYKRALSLEGAAKDIYFRVTDLSWQMIAHFVNNNPIAKPQVGNVVNFKRRTPDQSLIPHGLSLEEVYNYIRMLDAPDYPKAFIRSNGCRLEFESAEFIDNKLIAKVTFIKE